MENLLKAFMVYEYITFCDKNCYFITGVLVYILVGIVIAGQRETIYVSFLVFRCLFPLFSH